MKLFVACIAILALAPFAWASQGKGNSKPKDNGKDKQSQAAPPAAGAQSIRFSSSEIRLISDYYVSRQQQLPPGLAKKVQRGGTLPPGWQKKVQPFPRDLAARLPPVPAGCSRVVYGPTAVLVQDATNLVLDILDLTR
jgi:hypothetical protein